MEKRGEKTSLVKKKGIRCVKKNARFTSFFVGNQYPASQIFHFQIYRNTVNDFSVQMMDKCNCLREKVFVCMYVSVYVCGGGECVCECVCVSVSV